MSLDKLDLKDFGPENNHNHRYVLVISDKITKSGWTVLLRNKKTQSGKKSFENVPITSKRKPNLIEADPDIGNYYTLQNFSYKTISKFILNILA